MFPRSPDLPLVVYRGTMILAVRVVVQTQHHGAPLSFNEVAPNRGENRERTRCVPVGCLIPDLELKSIRRPALPKCPPRAPARARW